MCKSLEPDEIHRKILNYLSNESFINAIEFRNIENMKRFLIFGKQLLLYHCIKNVLMYLKSNYQPDSLTRILCKYFNKSIRNHILNFIRDKL